jgi:multisubunit Na+/H+ antiporter MnhG subunit
MNLWTLFTVLAAIAVLVRMGCFMNAMRAQHVPKHISIVIFLLAVAAVLWVVAPLWLEVRYSWRDALFSAAIAFYVWLQRRKPDLHRSIS